MNELYKLYKNKIIYEIKDIMNYSSIMQVPKIEKITLNIGIGDAFYNKKLMDNSLKELEKISCQKPIITKSKKSISNFKIRKGYPIGCKVTLRNKIMWIFIYKLINIAIPRIRDFRGLSFKSFDKNGNYNIGIDEQIIFPEIDYNLIDKIKGMDININIKSSSINESFLLLKKLNFPFKENIDNGK
ncbi:50S ribosomal protein L5 [endosymbiont of Pachyrhynchus infernalis]|uniref:50S ribosomal protein L5 n=1 Tax=endosymbiont of Pachyrhynchus infernalis TaxID=1971488 RepID=UPI000DC721E0|nr:50S ribosomal protein L5 [endosymbiont of Pachyrhynchus infernalis]BBA84844.1 50S ribosomal protein L5 [endosymbiont of Pachyrhynchus infernalis]